jgi:hypothetical protein
MSGKGRALRTDENEETSREVANAMEDRRTSDRTKQNYKSKIKMMTAWMALRFPQNVDIDGNLTIPLPKAAVIRFFSHLCSAAHALSKRGDDETEVTEDQVPLSVSHVKGFRSALVDLYKKANRKHDFNREIDQSLKKVLDGYEKTINDLKKDGLMDINEGKRHLKSDGYGLLARKLMIRLPNKETDRIEMDPQKSSKAHGNSWSFVTFAWSFFVVSWNLMSRSDSVDSIMLQHIEWAEDALVIEEQGHKGDQTGENKFDKHVYANPIEPMKCPVLSVAVLMFTAPPKTTTGKQQLYLGTNSKNRFGNILRSQLNHLSASEEQILGCPKQDIGAHSLRKGSSTYALGQVNGPTPVAVFLRMGQTLGKLKDRYIHLSEGSDQLCGRMVSGLPFNETTFGILPPHFPPETIMKMDTNFWNEVLDGYEHYPRGVKQALPFLLASLIYHHRFLTENLNPAHPIFKSRALKYNRLLDEMKHTVICGIGSCPFTGLKATGIPAHLAVATQVSRLAEENKKIMERLQTLEDRFEGKLDAIANELPRKLADEIRKSFVVDGVSPLTLVDLDQRIKELHEMLLRDLRQEPVSTERTEATERNVFEWRTWPGDEGTVIRFVPRGWDFPTLLPVKQMWDLWWFGERNDGIRPYYMISRVDIKEEHLMFQTRASKVMEFCKVLVSEMNLLRAGISCISKLTITEADSVFHRMFKRLLSEAYTDDDHGNDVDDGDVDGDDRNKSGRRDEVCYGTLYNKYCIWKKRNPELCAKYSLNKRKRRRRT